MAALNTPTRQGRKKQTATILIFKPRANPEKRCIDCRKVLEPNASIARCEYCVLRSMAEATAE